MNKLIITIAPTGNVPTKKLTPYVPLTPKEIVKDIKACANLGASVAHIHVRDDKLEPTSDKVKYKAVLDLLDEENVDIIRQVSTGARGGNVDSIEYRGQMIDLPQVQMSSLSTGSSNFISSINANSPKLVKGLAEIMQRHQVVPEIEIFDTAMIGIATFLKDKGYLKGNLHFNLVMNVPGSLPGTPKNLMFLVDSLPPGSTWSVSGIGKSHIQLLTMAIAMGGHVRTGLEDIISLDNQKVTNPELIERIVKIANAVGRPIATPAEAQELLNLHKKRTFNKSSHMEG